MSPEVTEPVVVDEEKELEALLKEPDTLAVPVEAVEIRYPSLSSIPAYIPIVGYHPAYLPPVEDKSKIAELVEKEAQELTKPINASEVSAEQQGPELVIREIEEESAGGLSKNKYIVHAVRPTLDTLFKLSF